MEEDAASELSPAKGGNGEVPLAHSASNDAGQMLLPDPDFELTEEDTAGEVDW